MIPRIIEFCAKNKFLVLVITAVAVALGVWSIRPRFIKATDREKGRRANDRADY